MAGTTTLVEVAHRKLKKLQYDWLSTAGGAADQASTLVYSGCVVAAVFEPDAAGTQPSDNYDVTVTDSDGYDVLAGQGANKSNAATVYVVASESLGACVESVLTLNVTNAGAAKGGVVTLFIAGEVA